MIESCLAEGTSKRRTEYSRFFSLLTFRSRRKQGGSRTAILDGKPEPHAVV